MRAHTHISMSYNIVGAKGRREGLEVVKTKERRMMMMMMRWWGTINAAYGTKHISTYRYLVVAKYIQYMLIHKHTPIFPTHPLNTLIPTPETVTNAKRRSWLRVALISIFEEDHFRAVWASSIPVDVTISSALNTYFPTISQQRADIKVIFITI